MTATPLKSRERVNRALERKEIDRVPRHDTFWPETLERWREEGLAGSSNQELGRTILGELESDFHCITWFWPHPFPGRNEVVTEDEWTVTTLGPSGTIERNWKHKSGTPEHAGWDCDSRERWEEVYKPAFLNRPVDLDVEAAKESFRRGRADDKWCFLARVEAFEEMRKLIGDEEAMVSVIEDPEWVMDIADTQATVLLRNYQAVLDAGIQPDGLWIYGDMAFRTMTFCSPDAYRELVWPSHRRILDWAHANGMKMIYHSDGDLRGVMDLYVEAGFDALQPLEAKASMDIRELVPTYGDRLSFFGNIDVMKMIPNDLELIEEEIRSKFAAGMARRSYLYHSDHSIPPQVSLSTYRAIIGMVDKYGSYT
jgi:uroporphyrinogen decarboxylase